MDLTNIPYPEDANGVKRNFFIWNHPGKKDDPKVTLFTNQEHVAHLKDFERAARWQYSPAKLKDGYRSDANFLDADVLVMDIDNDHSDDPEEWLTIEAIEMIFKDVPFYWETSRNHMKEKKGKAPRPKYHLLFPLLRDVKTAEDYVFLKKWVGYQFPGFFDEQDMKATQMKFVGENPQRGFSDGSINLDEWIKDKPKPEDEKKPEFLGNGWDGIVTSDGPAQNNKQGFVIYNLSYFNYCLEYIDPSKLSEIDWVKVGMALKYEGINGGFESAAFDLWDRWSSKDPRPEKGYEGTEANYKRWQTFKRSDVTGRSLTNAVVNMVGKGFFYKGLPAECKNENYNPPQSKAKPKQTKSQADKKTAAVSSEFSDDEIIQTLYKDDTFRILFSGKDMETLDLDPEQADVELFNRIATFTSDPVQIRRIALQSSLKRSKWQEDDLKYIDELVSNAIEYGKENWRFKVDLFLIWGKETDKMTGEVSYYLISNFANILTILRMDPNLPTIKRNLLTGIIEFHPKPGKGYPWSMGANESNQWNNAMDSGMDEYIYNEYGIDPKERHHTRAIYMLAEENSYHPVRDYLMSCPEWDGVERAETVFCDYLGAEDTPYTRGLTRITLSACVQRAFNPGIKWDNMLILKGDQGQGKSTLLARLAGDPEFFNDTVTIDMITDRGKEKYEAVSSAWFVEVGELVGLKRSEDEAVKSFLSSVNDKYRDPYARQATDHKRQCVIFGTTNERGPILKDPTGGRRYFPILLPRSNETDKRGWTIKDEDVKQIWAEVLHRWKDLKLIIPEDIEEEVKDRQEADTYESPEVATVKTYLEMPVPYDWERFTPTQRKAWFLAHTGQLEEYMNGWSSFEHQTSKAAEMAQVGNWYKNSERTYEVNRNWITDPYLKDCRIEFACLREIWEIALGYTWSSNKAGLANSIMKQVKGWQPSENGRKRKDAYGVIGRYFQREG